jgi:hypothetical protein
MRPNETATVRTLRSKSDAIERPVRGIIATLKTCSGIFSISRYTQVTRHLVAIGSLAEKEVIQ